MCLFLMEYVINLVLYTAEFKSKILGQFLFLLALDKLRSDMDCYREDTTVQLEVRSADNI